MSETPKCPYCGAETRLNESVYRVLQYKQLYGVFHP